MARCPDCGVIFPVTSGPHPTWIRCGTKPVEAMKQARVERDMALGQVDDHADDGWKELADAAIYATAQRYREFISDDVWWYAELPKTREDRALGPRMLMAARKGWIVKTDRVRPSIRSHASGKPVWRSLIHVLDAGQRSV